MKCRYIFEETAGTFRAPKSDPSHLSPPFLSPHSFPGPASHGDSGWPQRPGFKTLNTMSSWSDPSCCCCSRTGSGCQALVPSAGSPRCSGCVPPGSAPPPLCLCFPVRQGGKASAKFKLLFRCFSHACPVSIFWRSSPLETDLSGVATTSLTWGSQMFVLTS